MMRFLLSILVIHFSLTLISCTTPDTDDGGATAEDSSGAGPIDESDLATGDEGGGATATDDQAAAAAPAEDELENELESEPSATQATEEKAAPATGDEDLEKELGDNDLQEAPVAQNEPVQSDDLQPAPEPPAEPAPDVTSQPPAPPVEEKAKVTDIRYLSNANGGTVVIETTKPVSFQSRMNPATQQFVIEMADVELPPALQRPYNMKEFGSRFGSINAYQSPGSNTARVVIQMSKPGPEPMVQQEGTSLVVVPPAAPPVVAATTPEPGAAPAPRTKAAPPKEGALQARTLDEFLTGNQKFYGRQISLQVKDADVRDVVNFLAEESGANIVMSDDVSGKISLKLRKIPWDQALVTVMRSKALGYVRQGNVLRISTMKSLQAETDAANKLLESQKAIVPAVVQVIPISYAAVEDMQKSVTPFLTKETGKVVVDTRSSTLIVTDKAEVVDRIAKLVKTLDIAPAQVSIESKIVEAVEGFENLVGVNWSIGGSPIQLSSGGGANGAPIDLTPAASITNVSKDVAGTAPFSASMGVGVMDVFGNLAATLTLAEKDSLAKVISAPRISAMNREKSTIIQQGENVSIVQTRSETTGTITKTEKRTPFKLELGVTPQITADGGVIMELDVQREFLGPILDQDTKSQAVNTRKAKTKVLVRSGQTAVIGGIYTSDEEEQNSGVPVLKNLPVIGWLFKSRSVVRNKNELLIFMTPRILSAESANNEQAANL